LEPQRRADAEQHRRAREEHQQTTVATRIGFLAVAEPYLPCDEAYAASLAVRRRVLRYHSYEPPALLAEAQPPTTPADTAENDDRGCAAAQRRGEPTGAIRDPERDPMALNEAATLAAIGGYATATAAPLSSRLEHHSS
jgi:hypothetical protein